MANPRYDRAAVKARAKKAGYKNPSSQAITNTINRTRARDAARANATKVSAPRGEISAPPDRLQKVPKPVNKKIVGSPDKLKKVPKPYTRR
jgi:hypothetical protein